MPVINKAIGVETRTARIDKTERFALLGGHELGQLCSLGHRSFAEPVL
jgi:hypothetical protein